MEFKPANYGAAFEEVISESRLNSLTSGSPNQTIYDKLQQLDLKAAFAGKKVKNSEMAQACLSGVWIYHNYLEESHEISQDLHSTTGSFWHGMMHRREPDYPNAKYWFRRVDQHPIFEELCEDAQALASTLETNDQIDFLQTQTAWEPFQFVDLCEEVANSGSEMETLCQQIQLREWQLLFDYSYQTALGE